MSERKEPEEPKIDFSVPRILGSALAAATAAAIGSTLGVAGTIIGAAIASVVGAVAGTLYTAGIHRGGRGVWGVMQKGYQRIVGDSDSDDEGSTVASQASRNPDGRTEEPADAPGRTDETPARSNSTHPATIVLDDVFRPDDAGAGGSRLDDTLVLAALPADSGAPHRRRRGRLAWAIGASVGGAALIFVIAFLAITGIELATGSRLSGGGGTTISHVVNPSAPPSPSPTPTHTGTPSPTPAPDPTATAPETHSPSPEPGSPPTPIPSETPTLRPEVTPSVEPSGPPEPESSASRSVEPSPPTRRA